MSILLIQTYHKCEKVADYKESVIELLQRVCTVSVEMMGIIEKLDAGASKYAFPRWSAHRYT